MKNIQPHQTRRKALVLTVGTGDYNNLEQSLLRPLLTSIDEGNWDKVILLPSAKTVENAESIKSQVKARNVVCIPLDKDIETDADRCFGHFDSILEKLIKHEGFDKSEITLDFTRGTKAMSAALLMAGISWEIPRIRYVSGKERDSRGMVIAGTEKIEETNTQLVNARRLLSQAERLMQRGSFEAISLLLQDDLPNATMGYIENIRRSLQGIGAAAKVYSAWDRFDYKDAMNQIGSCQHLFGDSCYEPTPEMHNWLEVLGVGIKRQEAKEAAKYVQRLACDVLANAERRYRDGLFEDAYVRGYRVLELIGQYCLFERGYDSGQLPLKDREIIQFGEYLRNKGSSVLGRKTSNKESFAIAGRLQVARLLKHLGDPRGKRLIKLSEKRDRFFTKNRNESLLIHGFTAASAEQIKDLRTSIDDLVDFLRGDFSEASEYLTVARSLDFSIE